MRQLCTLLTFFAFLSLISITASGQDLAESRTSSYYTFIYRISNDQARILYKDIWDLEVSSLKNLYDMYPTDSFYNKKLPVGHYAFISAKDGSLSVQLNSVNNLDLKLLDNHRDMMMIFYDSLGKEQTGLQVKIKNKKITFDRQTSTYRLKKSNRKGLVAVLYSDHESFFEVDRQRNNGFALRTTKKVLGSFPINHLISPVVYLKNNIRNIVIGGRLHAPGIYYRTKKIFQFTPQTGYIAFNKPEYKPGDTVRLKGSVTSKRGKPYNKEIDVYLTKGYRDPLNKKLGTLKPFRKGAYKFEFKLADSLKLELDNSYDIEFKNRNGKKVLSSGFRYEDYELKQNTYSVRSENKSKGKPAVLFLKGVDSNDMSLYDVRVEVLLKPGDIKKYFKQKLFISDTLWYHETKLEPTGETRIIIPDSLMPSVEMSYEAVVSFLNSENECVQKTTSLSYTSKPFPISIEIINDSLVVASINDVKIPGVVTLEEFSTGHVKTRSITLPHREKLNLFAARYTVSYLEEKTSIAVDENPDRLNIMANRTRDSLFIMTENPGKIPFRYFLFRNQKLIEQSETTSLTLKRRVNTRDSYTLSIQYIWAGNPESREYDVPFDAKDLRIVVDHPSIVYPGQKANFSVAVHDVKGNPVKNVDLTAYAITKKFAASHAPSVPNLARPKRKRLIINEFNTRRSELNAMRFLDFAYWKKKLGLDSITYYKFLFPDSGYFENRTASAITQFAPFAVGYGRIHDVLVVYVDGQPVYYRQTGTLEPYSFAIKPGIHTIGLRLQNALITVNKIRIDRGQKLIFSINRYNLPKNCSVTDMPFQFTDEELTKLSRYFIAVNSSGQNDDAYIQQGDRYHIFSWKNYNYQNVVLTGPFYPGKATYYHKSGYNVPFEYESRSSYTFSENLLKLREIDMSKQLKGYFGWNSPKPSLRDTVNTLQTVKKYWKSLEEKKTYSFKRFPEFAATSKRTGRLVLKPSYGVKPGYAGSQPDNRLDPHLIKAVFILNLDHPDEYYVLPGTAGSPPFNEGRYQAIVIHNDESYLRVDSVIVKPFGTNYYDLKNYKKHERDTFSIHVMEMIDNWSSRESYMLRDRELELQKVRELYYKETSANYFFDHVVRGRITDESGIPIPGVNVIVKGTAMGTTTDADGYYTIKCPANGTLIISFIGYATSEIPIENKIDIDVSLVPDVSHLSEVVVVGYGMTRSSRYLTGSVATTTLNGRVAGMQIDGYNALTDSVSIAIRGFSSITGNNEPLVILDGKVIRLSDINPNQITAMEILKDAQATAIYGARAANGVILISSKPGVGKEYLKQMSQPLMTVGALAEVPGNALRKNFRDYAFWKPDLQTDENGKATFTATFPDDITGWNTFVLGIGSHRRTGQTSSFIQSYKPLIAQIAQPHFLIEGDQARGIGKITSYSNEKIQLNRQIKINDKEVMSGSVELQNSKIDSIALAASGKDSLSIEYTVTYNDYKDGELRKIPVYRKGTMEANGIFVALERDTTFTVNFSDAQAELKLYAQADLIDVMLDEIGFLKKYSYECNEQLASRLRALILERLIKKYKGETPGSSREIEKTIRKLVGYQNKDGSWSWWKTGPGQSWISLHIAKSLMLAEKEGFAAAYDKEQLINYIESELTGLSVVPKLNAFQFLLEHGQVLKIKDIIESVKKSKAVTLHERLLAEKLLQWSGEKVNQQWLNSVRSETIKGNYYWGEEKNDLADNAVHATLLAYQILSKEDPSNKDLVKIRSYFLEQRKKTWRNTYESALILETLLPSLLQQKRSAQKTQLKLSGGTNKTIDTFPFEGSADRGTVTITKTGSDPIYFTAWQETWNSTPPPSSKDFVISTSFDNNGEKLTAGKPVRLNIKVEVIRDAEYVMIEVPIPAGCSYQSKQQNNSNGEVHREFFNHKTNIFCRYLKKGVYSYSIELLPRYSGRYTLNPAVIECMYFPVLYGREGMKEVTIE